jgi:alpha-ribazole phosphatase
MSDIAVTRWWLVRHAPVAGAAGRMLGREDAPADVGDIGALTALAGVLPAHAVWLATPLRRTRDTAAALRAVWPGETPAAPRIEAELIEQHFGLWEGLSYDELLERHAVAARRFWSAPATRRPPAGESFADVVARVRSAMARLTAAHAGGDVVAVIHAGPIRAALAVALGIKPAAALSVQVAPLSLTRLDHLSSSGGASVWRIGAVNLPPGAHPP